jgi:hypothetical protein
MMNMILETSDFNNKVMYLEGNPLKKQDLIRCLAGEAECVVVLSNKLTSDPR